MSQTLLLLLMQYLRAVELHFAKDPLSMAAFVELFALFENDARCVCVLAAVLAALARGVSVCVRMFCPGGRRCVVACGSNACDVI